MISNTLLADHVHAAGSFPSKLPHMHFWLKYHKQVPRILKVTFVSYFKPELMLMCTKLCLIGACSVRVNYSYVRYVLITRRWCFEGRRPGRFYQVMRFSHSCVIN